MIPRDKKMRRMKVWIVRVQKVVLDFGQTGVRLEWVATYAPFFSRKQCEDWIADRLRKNPGLVFLYEPVTPEEYWSDPKDPPPVQEEKKHSDPSNPIVRYDLAKRPRKKPMKPVRRLYTGIGKCMYCGHPSHTGSCNANINPSIRGLMNYCACGCKK